MESSQTLESKALRLVPPAIEQAESLWALTGPEEELWQYVNNGYHRPKSLSDLKAKFETMVAYNEKEDTQVFVMQSKINGDYIGITSFLDINPMERHLEVGSTFIAPAYRSGTTNFEVKLLMLTEAFEVRGCERVTFKANASNTRSRRAIVKIGATFEGILRHHRLLADGTWRDSAYYSILRNEWPDVKHNLESRIASS